MLKLTKSEKLGRMIRKDDWEDLGIPTPKMLMKAIDEGRYSEAKALALYRIPEGKALHDLYCDWIWDILTKTAEFYGEEAVYKLCRSTQETWMLKRTWKALLKMPVEERVYVNAEIMRSHRCGPEQDGQIEIIDEPDRISIKMDPCGSGGRMRRGDPVDGTPSRLGPPYNFGVTKSLIPGAGENLTFLIIACIVLSMRSYQLSGGLSSLGNRLF